MISLEIPDSVGVKKFNGEKTTFKISFLRLFPQLGTLRYEIELERFCTFLSTLGLVYYLRF